MRRVYRINQRYRLDKVLGDSYPVHYEGSMEDRTMLRCPRCSCIRLAREWQFNTAANILLRGSAWMEEKHSLYIDNRARFVCPNCESFIKKEDLIVYSPNKVLEHYPIYVELEPYINPAGLHKGG